MLGPRWVHLRKVLVWDQLEGKMQLHICRAGTRASSHFVGRGGGAFRHRLGNQPDASSNSIPSRPPLYPLISINRADYPNLLPFSTQTRSLLFGLYSFECQMLDSFLSGRISCVCAYCLSLPIPVKLYVQDITTTSMLPVGNELASTSMLMLPPCMCLHIDLGMLCGANKILLQFLVDTE